MSCLDYSGGALAEECGIETWTESDVLGIADQEGCESAHFLVQSDEAASEMVTDDADSDDQVVFEIEQTDQNREETSVMAIEADSHPCGGPLLAVVSENHDEAAPYPHLVASVRETDHLDAELARLALSLELKQHLVVV